MKKVLITGINGFVGRSIARKLLNKYNVTGIARNYRSLTGLPVEYICADISDGHSLASLYDCCYDVVIHCAASISMENTDSELMDTNVRGFLNILRFAKRIKCRHFVYLSSVQVIGIPTVLPITEAHSVYPQTFYHLTKYIGETFLEESMDELPSTVLRISSPIGVGMPKKRFLPFLVNRCLEGKSVNLLGQGGRVQNYIDVSEIAGAVAQVLDLRKTGVYNIASARSYSNLEVAEICIKTLHSSSDITFSGDDREESNRWIFSIEKARKDLDFNPVKTLEETIKELSIEMNQT